MDFNLTKFCRRVITEAPVVFPEVPKREAVEVAAMRRIAKRAEVRVVRSLNPDSAPGSNQPVKLLHGADYVVYVLDHMDRGQPVERTVGERVGKAIEVGQDVGAAVGIPVEPNGSGLLVNPAADV